MFKNLLNFLYLALIGLFGLFFIVVFIFYFFGKDLPSFDKLSYYQPRLVSKIFTSNGNFLEDYSTENRVFSSYDEIPKELINCFLVSEDINFFNHIGIDFKGIARAFYKKANILIFDESTSALDDKTEKEVINSISKLICFST